MGGAGGDELRLQQRVRRRHELVDRQVDREASVAVAGRGWATNPSFGGAFTKTCS
jgi:hypothetical protein